MVIHNVLVGLEKGFQVKPSAHEGKLKSQLQALKNMWAPCLQLLSAQLRAWTLEGLLARASINPSLLRT